MTAKEEVFCFVFHSIFYLTILSSATALSLHLVSPLGHRKISLACGTHFKFHTCCTWDNSQSYPLPSLTCRGQSYSRTGTSLQNTKFYPKLRLSCTDSKMPAQEELYLFFPCKNENTDDATHAFNTRIPVIAAAFEIVRNSKTSEWLRGSDSSATVQKLVPLGTLLSFIALYSCHPLRWLISQFPSLAPPHSIFVDVLSYMTISLVFRRGMSPSVTWK